MLVYDNTESKWILNKRQILIRRKIPQQYITDTNIYETTVRTLKDIKQTLKGIRGQKWHDTIIAGDFNISLSILGRLSKLKPAKKLLCML